MRAPTVHVVHATEHGVGAALVDLRERSSICLAWICLRTAPQPCGVIFSKFAHKTGPAVDMAPGAASNGLATLTRIVAKLAALKTRVGVTDNGASSVVAVCRDVSHFAAVEAFAVFGWTVGDSV